MIRLDEVRRVGSLICMRDKADKDGIHRPWAANHATAPLGTFIHLVAKMRDTAGLPKDITFRPFRHGGFTAGRDADLSDADIKAVGAKTGATIDLYAKSTLEQRRRAFKRMRDQRVAGGSSGPKS
jgi:hypothetical protein